VRNLILGFVLGSVVMAGGAVLADHYDDIPFGSPYGGAQERFNNEYQRQQAQALQEMARQGRRNPC
jgi:uncharacterized protein YbjQ (UPF0145 family)